MKTYLDCLPCFLDQALRTGKLATKDEQKIKRVLYEVGKMFPSFSFEQPPAGHSEFIYKKIAEISGNSDPFKEIKEKCIKQALKLYPLLEQIYRSSQNKLDTAIRIAITGNVIDFARDVKFNLEKDLKKILKQKFAISVFDDFKRSLSLAKNLLYISDNAGETVFDKILIKHLGLKTFYAVKNTPILNDATRKDAVKSGLEDVCTIIDSGSRAPGTILNRCTNEFIQIFNSADLIISKGQGNYEGLSVSSKKIYFLLKTKCPIVAKNLGVKNLDIVFTKNDPVKKSF